MNFIPTQKINTISQKNNINILIKKITELIIINYFNSNYNQKDTLNNFIYK